MTCDRDAASERMLRDSLAGFPKVVLDIHEVDASRLSGVFVDKHLSKEAYLRFLAAEVLPETLDRVVYLDCDLVVLDDIFELYDTDLNGMAIGAVEDARWADGATESRLARLGARPGAPYVNSGVLVLDLHTWRRDNLARDLFAFVAEHGSLLLRHDQDALNVVLQDRIRLLDKRWNVQTLMFSPAARKMLLPEDEAAKQARRHPGIVHYSTGSKPWAFRAPGRRKHIYFGFREATAWRAARPQLEFPGAADRVRRGKDAAETAAERLRPAGALQTRQGQTRQGGVGAAARRVRELSGACKDPVPERQPTMSAIRRSVLASIADKYVTQAISVVTLAVMSRILTPAETGLYLLANTVILLADNLRLFGIGNYIVQEKDLDRDTTRSAFTITLVMSLGIALAIHLAAGGIADFFREPELAHLVSTRDPGVLRDPLRQPADRPHAA